MKRSVDVRGAVRDVVLIVSGSILFAIGVDCFQIPNGLAAGGVTGLATVIHAVLLAYGIDFPVGLQTMIANAFLLLLVVRTGGKHYLVRTVGGIIASGLALDLLAPVVPVLGNGDLLLCSIWGGAIAGVGLGLVFRSGGNTGGTDILAQLMAKHTSLTVGAAAIVLDAFIIAASVPVFSLENALYAVVCLFICGYVLDAVVDGPTRERAAYIVSTKHDRIANAIMYEMRRGCTEIQARGVWSGNSRPMLFVVLSRTEVGYLKSLVSQIDPDAVVVISEVHEAFGEGFGRLQLK